MLTYILIGLALGSIYALAAASLVVTYASAGILNFAFGSMAFFAAKFFYWANQTEGWNLGVAAVVSLLVVAPGVGLLLYLAVFRFLRGRSTLVKLVSSIGVSVAFSALALMLFGNATIAQAPGLAPEPVKFWKVFGATLTLNQVIIYAFLIVVVGVGTFVMRWTDVGLRVRAVVNSEALASLSGTNPNRIALGVWAISGLLAGAAGIMAGPTVGVTAEAMTLLMVSSFAAVVAARLRNLGTAIIIALLMGVLTDAIQDWLPVSSVVTTDIVQSIPFALIVVFLVYYLIRGDAVGHEATSRSTLDAAITPGGGEQPATTVRRLDDVAWDLHWYSPRSIISLVPLVLIVLLPEIFSGYWLGLVARGIALAIVLLSYSLVTGDGGMIWLCQITFAGGAGLIASELVTNHGFSPIEAGLIGALLMVPLGVLVGALTIRLGELYVALVTLSFGLLIDTVVFSLNQFAPGLGGVPMLRPSFASSDRAFAYFALAVFLIVGLVVVNLRRSTPGLAISAIRSSQTAARTIGLNVVRMKLVLSAIATFIAGLGGAVLAMYDMSTDPLTYATLNGLVWLAVLVTIGVRSVTASLIAGLSFVLLPAVFSVYLVSGVSATGSAWLQVPSLLFGLGAVGLAVNPEGVVAMNARYLKDLIFGRAFRATGRSAPVTGRPADVAEVQSRTGNSGTIQSAPTDVAHPPAATVTAEEKR